MFTYTEIIKEYARVTEVIDIHLIDNRNDAAISMQTTIGDDYTVMYQPEHNCISFVGKNGYDFIFDIERYDDYNLISKALTVNLYDEKICIYEDVKIRNLEFVVNECKCKYKFIRMLDLADRLIKLYNNKDYETTINFTDDTSDTCDIRHEEPYGWNGIKLINAFDNIMVVFGHYGSDYGGSVTIWEDNRNSKSLAEALCDEMLRTGIIDRKSFDVTSEICIEK